MDSLFQDQQHWDQPKTTSCSNLHVVPISHSRAVTLEHLMKSRVPISTENVPISTENVPISHSRAAPWTGGMCGRKPAGGATRRLYASPRETERTGFDAEKEMSNRPVLPVASCNL
jgi:hypothetical protein